MGVFFPISDYWIDGRLGLPGVPYNIYIYNKHYWTASHRTQKWPPGWHAFHMFWGDPEKLEKKSLPLEAWEAVRILDLFVCNDHVT